MDEQLRQRLMSLQRIPGPVERPGLLPLGIPAIDKVLGGGLMRGAMLSCLRKALDLVDQHYGERYTLATIEAEDPAVYRMLRLTCHWSTSTRCSRAQTSSR